MPEPTEIRVRGYHLDFYAHVNNARYVEFLEEGRWDLFEKLGLLPDFLASEQALIVVNVNVAYRRAACLNDILLIDTKVKKLGRRQLVLQQLITRRDNGLVVAEGEVTLVLLDQKAEKLIAIEGDMLALLSQLPTTRKIEIAT